MSSSRPLEQQIEFYVKYGHGPDACDMADEVLRLRVVISKQSEDLEKLRAANEWLRAQAKQGEAVRAEQAKQLRKAAEKDRS